MSRVLKLKEFCKAKGFRGFWVLFFVFSGFVCFPQVLFAAPSISGVSGGVSQGQFITISGSGFGTKNPAKPQLWAPFDDNKNPSPLGVVTSWRVSDPEILWGSGYGWSGGGVKCGNQLSRSNLLAATFNGWNFNDPGQKFYVHRRAKRLYNTGSVGGSGGLKAMKFDYNESYGDNIVLNLTTNQWISQNYGNSAYYYLNSFPNNSSSWVVEETVVQSNVNSNAWSDFDFYVNYGKVGDGPSPKQITLWASGTQPFNTVSFWRYASGSPLAASASEEFWDDLYVDNTWSRVMLGSASTFNGSTKREIQIPSAWSANSVTISVNTGSFSTGQTAYLYVIDASGQVNSNGYPVTIGASSGSATPVTPPSPPAGSAPAAPSLSPPVVN